jgi:broad specificity polyphosphatase/5'/3'-nucleotidase SurE
MKHSLTVAAAVSAALVAVAATAVSWALLRRRELRRHARLELRPLESWENEGGALASR